MSKKYKITYNGNGNTGGSTAETSFTYGNTASVRANGFTRTGYTFTGWNTKANGSGTAYAAGASYKAAANLTLYAQWKAETYEISWTLRGRSFGYNDHNIAGALDFGDSTTEKQARISYIDANGKTAYLNPYSQNITHYTLYEPYYGYDVEWTCYYGTVSIMKGTSLTFEVKASSGGYIEHDLLYGENGTCHGDSVVGKKLPFSDNENENERLKSLYDKQKAAFERKYHKPASAMSKQELEELEDRYNYPCYLHYYNKLITLTYSWTPIKSRTIRIWGNEQDGVLTFDEEAYY